MNKYASINAFIEAVPLDFKSDNDEGWTDALLEWLPSRSSLGRDGSGRLVSVNFPLREGSTAFITARHGDVIFKSLGMNSYSVMNAADFKMYFVEAYPLKARLMRDSRNEFRVSVRNSHNGKILFVTSESYHNRADAVSITDKAFPGVEWDEEES